MGEDNFILDLIASLLQSKSKKQIKEDIKSMGDIKFPLVGTLSPKTKAQLKKDIASLDGTINLTGKVNSKGVVTSLQQATAQAQKQADSKPVEMSFSVKKDKLLNDIKLLAQQNSKLFKNSDMSIKYNSLLDNASMARNSVELSALRTQLGSLRSELKITGNAGLTFGDSLKKSLSKVMGLFGNFNIIMQFRQQLHNAWTEAEELDKSMTDLSRVNAEITRSGFPDYLDKVISKTKQLAVATKDYIDSVTTFSRAGYNLADSETLAQAAVQLEKVGDMSAVDASKALLAGLQGYAEIGGYGMDQLTEKAQALNDRIDIIGNTASITQAELSRGIQAVGSVMNDANTSVDEFLALLGAGNRAVQDSDKVALAIRTSALRIRGCTTELQEMGEETDNVIESTSTLAEKIKALTNINGSGGVNILEADEETFRSIFDIYNDISKVYDKMSDKDASALLDLIAGKNRSNQISAILQNMSEANELLESSLSAAGTASEEYQIYLDSVEAATERFGVAMTEAYSSIISGDTVKGLANTGAAVLDFANSWNILEGTIKGFLALGILKGVTTLTVAFKSSALQISNYGKALDAVKQVSVHAQGTEKYAKAMDTLTSSCVNLTDAQLKQVLANRNLEKAQLIEILQLDVLEEEQREARLAQLGLIQTTEEQAIAQGAATASTFSLSAAIKGLGASIKAAWMTNRLNIIIMGISTAIGVATSLISKYNQQLEETRRANIESATTASENADKLKDLYNEYTRLASIQDRTTSEEEAFKTVIEDITIALGNKAEVLENLTAGTDEYADALARVTKEELQSQAVTATIGRKSAEEELQGKTWDKWSGSQVTIDSNSKGQSLSDEAQKAVDIVSESLKEYETINRTWKNISWDISSDDPTQALEYYNSLVEAREKLVLASEDDESLLDTEIYEDLNTAINSMSESLDTYIEKLYEEEKLNYMAQNGIPSVTEEYKAMESALVNAAGSSADLQNRFKELLTSDFSDLATDIGNVGDAVNDVSVQVENISVSFEDAWSDSFTSENDKVRELGDTLLGLAEKGRLTKEIFEEADSTAGDYFKNLGVSADEAVAKINKLVDESNQLSSMASQISFMAEALGTKQENGFVSADTLSGFDVEVRGLESWDRFQEVLGSTTSSYGECQEAANALATEWVNSSDFLAQLTEQNEEYYKTQLESMGIENYEEVISYANALNEAKEVLSQSSLELGNATYDEIEALIVEGQYSELTANMILALYDAKIAEQAATLDTSADCANLIALAGDTDRTSQSIQLLIQLMDIYSGLESGAYNGNRLLREEALGEVDRIKKELEALANGETDSIEIEPTVKLGNRGRSSAKSAGKDAGKSFKDALKEELSDLESVISGVTSRIDDQISSVNEQKSAALESIDAQKEAIESAKESAVSALEAERDARLEVIETQKAQREEEIKLIEKQIKSKQDEIKSIEDVAAARAREISLQEKEYALEQKRNQRTKLVYTESSGMVYRPDEQGMRKAKEAVDDAKRQIEIANIQKEIDLLEDQKDLLNEQIDLLDEQADAVNKYYDEQIKQTEKYYDSLIKNLEKQRKETEAYYESITKSLEQRKEKFQELTEILEKAELSAKLKQLGIDEEALLNGSEEEFEKLKKAYMDIVFQLNKGNDDVLNALRDLSGYEGTAPAVLEESNTKLGTMNDELGNATTKVGNVNSSLDKTASTTSDVATNVSDVNTNIGETVGLVNNEKGAFDELKQTIDLIVEAINQKIQAIEAERSAVSNAVGIEMADFQLLINKIQEVKEKLDEVNNTVTTMDRQPIDNLANAFQLLYAKVLLVSNLLGVGVEGESAVSGISGAIQALNEISLEEGIIAQFNNLKTAIDQVTAAISGGGGESSEGSGSGGTSGSKGGKQGGSGSKGGKGSEGESGGGNSLTGAITEMGNKAKKVIGEPDAEGDGTVIGEFGSMETAVNDVRDAIGTEGSAGGEGQCGDSGGETDDTLVGSIEYLGDKTEEEMGESGGDGIIGRFEEFRDVIGEADEHVKSISDGLNNIDGKEVSCTIKINIIRTESGGGGGDSAAGESELLGSMNLNSATYNAKYKGNAHYEGTAKLTGDWGVKEGGRTLCGEMGQEIVVRGSKFFTVGDNGAEFVNLQKGDLVFNHLQTKELLSKGNIVGRGRALSSGTALANGTSNNADDSIWTTLADGTKVRPLQPGDKMYDMVQKFDAYFKSIDGNLEKLVPNSIYEHQRQMEDMAKQINYVSSVVNNNRNVQQPVVHQQFNITMPNVTDSTSAATLMNDLQSLATKKYQVNW